MRQAPLTPCSSKSSTFEWCRRRKRRRSIESAPEEWRTCARCPTLDEQGPRSPQSRPKARFDGTWRAEAGDPPEHAQDNPPPLPGGSLVLPIYGEVALPHAVGKYRRSRRGWGRAGGAGGILKLIPPGLVDAVLL